MAGDFCPVIDGESTKLLIRGGTVVNADRQLAADIYIEDGIIVAIEPNIKVCKHSNLLLVMLNLYLLGPKRHSETQSMHLFVVDVLPSG